MKNEKKQNYNNMRERIGEQGRGGDQEQKLKTRKRRAENSENSLLTGFVLPVVVLPRAREAALNVK